MRSMLIVAVALAGAGTAGASPASTLADVQKFYAAAPQLTAAFRQTVTQAAFGRVETSDGKIFVTKPVKLRAEYYASAPKGVTKKKEFVYDGADLWYLDHVNKTITRTPAATSALPAAVSFLTGGSALATDYTLALDTSGTYADRAIPVLQLTPKQANAGVKTMFFVVDAKDAHVKRSIVIDAKGDTNDFAFYAPDTKTKPDAKLFKFDILSLPSTYKLQLPPSSNKPAP